MLQSLYFTFLGAGYLLLPYIFSGVFIYALDASVKKYYDQDWNGYLSPAGWESLIIVWITIFFTELIYYFLFGGAAPGS